MVDISVIDSSAQILTGGKHDYDALLKLIGDARFVLLGEASHGTQEFYHERALIVTCAIKAQIFRLMKHCLVLHDFQHGCGAILRC